MTAQVRDNYHYGQFCIFPGDMAISIRLPVRDQIV